MPVEQCFTDFHTEEDCQNALFKARWPEGFRCPSCTSGEYYLLRTRRHPLFECRHCRRQTSLIAGTILEGTRTPLRKWFAAMRFVSVGISATDLMERIGVTYKTAWLINHKLRHAMMQANGELLLSGLVHIQDGIYTGSPYWSSSVSHPKDQPIVAGASLNEAREPIQLMMRQVDRSLCKRRYPDFAAGALFAAQHVDSDAEEVFVTPRPSKGRHCVSLYRTFYQALRWLGYTFRGIGPKHLQAYLDEFCYRFNADVSDQSLFTRLLVHCASTATITHRSLVLRPPFTHPKGLFHRSAVPERFAHRQAVA